MGAIVAYLNDAALTVTEQKRQGMRALGQSMVDNIQGNPTRDKLLTALRYILDAKVGAAMKYTLKYEFKDGANLTDATIKKMRKGMRADIINCRMIDANNEISFLRLKFEQDSRENDDNLSLNFFMSIRFPDGDDFDNFSYLAPAADDIAAIHAQDPGEAVKYLAAFKFLSRCK